MRYFDGLVSSSFKETPDGIVYFPMGMLGRGRIVPNAADAEALKATLKRYYLVMIGGIVAISAASGWMHASDISLLWRFGPMAAAVALSLAWFWLVIMPRARHWPVSREKLSFADVNAAGGRAYGRSTLVVLAAISAFLILGGVFGLFIAASRLDWWLAVFAVVFFGACLAQISLMIARAR